MTIPIANIYYLLLYAWRHVEKRNQVDVGEAGRKDLLNLLAHVFTLEVRRLLARGLAREYSPVEEAVTGIRGKIDVGVTLKRDLLRQAKAWCSYDELRYDIPRNRILKATLRLLLRVPQLDSENRDAARHLYAKLDAVKDVPWHPSLFRGVQSHRLVREYDFSLRLARLIGESVVLEKDGHASRFLDFSEDEARMSALFEDFVFNFYALEHPEWQPRRRIIQWFEAHGSEEALSMLPSMHTDVYLTIDSRRVIMDAKFYKDPLKGRFGSSISSSNLYQLFAYVDNESASATPSVVEGILLYAAVGEPFSYQYRLRGHRIGVRGLDLTQPWPRIHEDLMRAAAEPPAVSGIA